MYGCVCVLAGIEQVLLERGVDTRGMTLWGNANNNQGTDGDEDDAEDESEMLIDTEEIERDHRHHAPPPPARPPSGGENDHLIDEEEDENDRIHFTSINGFPMGRVKDTGTSMYYCLANHFSDFRNERGSLYKLLDKLGCTFIALPKYHCELNPIELIWGGGKREFRKINDHTWAGLKTQAKNCFFGLPRETVAKMFRKTRDFSRALMDKNNSVTMYEYVDDKCKKARAIGKCHWRPPVSLLKVFDPET